MTSSVRRERVKDAILHERQEEGSMLCAQHALNNLLQGTYFDAVQLADIAAQLDRLERVNLNMSDSEWGDREAGGRNADETGFFSVGVIETALQVWGLSLLRWNSSDMRQYHDAPEQQLAFILNLQSHWFSFRSFGWSGDLWFNLNSFLEQPTWVGTGYLGALLDQSQTEGYSVFVVRPASTDPLQVQSILSQIRSCPADVAAACDHDQHSASDRDEEEDLKRALAASLASVDDDSGTASHSSTVSEAEPLQPSLRRKSKRQGEDGLKEALTASMKASSSSWRGSSAGPSRVASGSGTVKRKGTSPHTGSTRDTPIELDDDSGDDMEADYHHRRRPEAARSPFLNPALGNHFLQGHSEEDELETLDTLESPSFGRAQAQGHSHLTEPFQSAAERQDAIEILSDDGEEEQASLAWTSATTAFRDLRDRDYDDEDAELQRALAASMADPSSSSFPSSLSADGTKGDDYSSAKAIQEQSDLLAAIAAAQQSQRSPTPDDVGRIARMREEEAKRRRREREELTQRQESGRGSDSDRGKGGGGGTEGKRKDGEADDAEEEEEEDDDEEEEEEEGETKQMSAEELRKIRLARFAL